MERSRQMLLTTITSPTADTFGMPSTDSKSITSEPVPFSAEAGLGLLGARMNTTEFAIIPKPFFRREGILETFFDCATVPRKMLREVDAS
jgi:hypothetical protein